MSRVESDEQGVQGLSWSQYWMDGRPSRTVGPYLHSGAGISGISRILSPDTPDQLYCGEYGGDSKG